MESKVNKDFKRVMELALTKIFAKAAEANAR
jgi:hypothetical protein